MQVSKETMDKMLAQMKPVPTIKMDDYAQRQIIDLIDNLKAAQDALTCKQIDHAAMGQHGRSHYALAELRLDTAENNLREFLGIPLVYIDPDVEDAERACDRCTYSHPMNDGTHS